jgi:hypothetical protein
MRLMHNEELGALAKVIALALNRILDSIKLLRLIGDPNIIDTELESLTMVGGKELTNLLKTKPYMDFWERLSERIASVQLEVLHSLTTCILRATNQTATTMIYIHYS